MERAKTFIRKHWEILSYLFFGGLTTLVNLAVYLPLYNWLHISATLSNAIAWVVAVAFAFVTNKLFVFESKEVGTGRLIYEIGSFFASRVLTGALDVGIMYLFVTRLEFDDLVIKIASNIVVIVLNYVLSRLIVFKEERE
jgi:putative flippase GtrA